MTNALMVQTSDAMNMRVLYHFGINKITYLHVFRVEKLVSCAKFMRCLLSIVDIIVLSLVK